MDLKSVTPDRPLRIMHSEAATSFGGQEGRIFREMIAMRERGHHLEAICQPDAVLTRRLRDEGFQVHTMFMDGAANFFKGVIRIRRILRAGGIEVLNTHSRRDTMLAGLAARLAGTPLIVRTRHLARRPNSLLSYTVIPHRVTTVSEFVRQQLLDRDVPADHVQTIYSPVRVRPAHDPGLLRRELGLDSDDLVVGCVAVLRRAKGLQELIDAMRPLFAAYPRLHLVIVGEGSPLFEELQQLAEQRGLQGRIHLLGRRNDVPDLLAGFDIFALATREEASGTVFVEAGAAGLPIVATNVGGVHETMLPGESGLLVELDDGPGLTAALKTLIDDPGLRQRMGRAGQAFYQDSGRFSTAGMVAATEACYRRWLQERRP